MHILRSGFFLVFFLFVQAPFLAAGDFSHTVDVEMLSMWGDSSYEISFTEGHSRLEWPMDMHALEATYTVCYRDVLEIDMSMAAKPWTQNQDVMEDYDWVDESYYSGRADHDGVDIFSQSDLDAKIFMMNANSRLFFFTYKPVSFALLAGYNYCETDYRVYNTRQVGYGSWQNQSDIINGPTITYALETKSVSVGMSCRLHMGRQAVITLDAAFLPYVKASDEDNHIRRFRVSQSECTGTGTEISISTRFNMYKNWDIHTQCTKKHISTSGDQTQYWYGDDPATSSLVDTGSYLSGIDTDIDEDLFQISLGIGCRF